MIRRTLVHVLGFEAEFAMQTARMVKTRVARMMVGIIMDCAELGDVICLYGSNDFRFSGFILG